MFSKIKSISFLLLIAGIMYQCSSALKVPTVSDALKSNTSLDTLLAGRSLYVKNCGSCHNLHLPNEYDAAGWKLELDKMQEPAKINDKKKEVIYRYLTTMTNKN